MNLKRLSRRLWPFRARPLRQVISYPKSGRTWVRYVLELADVAASFSHAGHGTAGARQLGAEFRKVSRRALGQRTLFLHRDAIDTAVSLFFQVHKHDFLPTRPDYEQNHRRLARQQHLPPRDIDEFVQHQIWGVPQICRFNRAYISLLAARNDCLVLSYEALRAEPHRHFSMLLTFFGADDFDIDALVARSEFDQMRNLELNNPAQANRRMRLHGAENGDVEAMKVRKGKVGGYRDYLQADTITATRRICADHGFTA